MSKPPLNPKKTLSGITVDPQTLERVIPESKRSDGTVRKQIKIRPGYTPQEDVGRFRSTKQAQMDAKALPKGHIVGWAPAPPPTTAVKVVMSKSAKKNARRREKKREEKPVPENWEDDLADDDAETAKEPDDAISPTEHKPSGDTKELVSKLGKLAI